MRHLQAYLGPGVGTVTVEFDKITSDHRPRFRYWIETSEGLRLEEAADLSLGSGHDPNHVEALATLLVFLGAAAESYGYCQRHRIDLSETENGTLFAAATTEWAYMNAEEIDMAATELRRDRG